MSSRPSEGLTGNQVWAINIGGRRVVQKLYIDPDWSPKFHARLLLERIARRKTSSRAETRCRVERDVLAVWRAHGFDVPEDLTDRYAFHASGPATVLEFVRGPALAKSVGGRRHTTERLHRALRRFAVEWGRRHEIAIRESEPRLVQEHGSFAHVLVTPERLVTIDFEQAFVTRDDVEGLVAKEVVSYLRSLRKRMDEEPFRAALRVLIDAYPRRDLLERTVQKYLAHPHPFRRLCWAVDRAMRSGRRRPGGKYDVIRSLDAVLRSSV